MTPPIYAIRQKQQGSSPTYDLYQILKNLHAVVKQLASSGFSSHS